MRAATLPSDAHVFEFRIKCDGLRGTGQAPRLIAAAVWNRLWPASDVGKLRHVTLRSGARVAVSVAMRYFPECLELEFAYRPVRLAARGFCLGGGPGAGQH